MRNVRKAFTLLELMLVIAIVVLTSTILFPVFVSAKRESKKATCIEGLRQIGIATLMYREDEGGLPRSWGLDGIANTGYLKDHRLLLCPLDPFDGFATEFQQCVGTHNMKQRTSYHSPFSPTTFYWESLLRADPNAGIAACQHHGRKIDEFFTTGGSHFCQHIMFFYEGRTLRLCLDGSVKSFEYVMQRKPAPDGTTMRVFRFSRLFVDKDIDLATDEQ